MTSEVIGTDVSQVSPKTLDHIIGQPILTESLKVVISAYWNERSAGRDIALSPILLCSPPSGGKTTVAMCIHNELANGKFVETIGESLNHLPDLYASLMDSDEDTTIFVDECQGIGSSATHVLLKVLSEGKLCLPKGKSASKYHTIPIAKGITYIFATTHEFCLSSALRSRMRTYRFDEYTSQTIYEILKQRFISLKWQIESDDCLLYIAQRSKLMPRLALSNLQASYNVCRGDNREIIKLRDVKKAFWLSQTDNELGLDKLDMSYLGILFSHSPAKLNVIASKLGLPNRTIQEVVEPYLIKQGLIDKRPDRYITEQGKLFLAGR